MGPMEEALGEPRHEVDTDPQEPAWTLGLNIEYLFQFSFFSSIPRGARVTCSPRNKEEGDFSITMALNLSQKPQPCGVDATQATGTLEPERREETELPEVGELEGIPTSTLAREHLARASPITVSTDEEEIAIGEEEGPSKAILMN